MSIEEKLLKIMEASSTVLTEAKKEYTVGDVYTLDWDGPSRAKVSGVDAKGVSFRRIDKDGKELSGQEHEIHIAHSDDHSDILKEAKKEDPPEEKKEDEKEEADEVDQEPAVKIDNPLTPDLTTSESGEGSPEEEESEEETDEKKEVKESTDELLEGFKPFDKTDWDVFGGAHPILPGNKDPEVMEHGNWTVVHSGVQGSSGKSKVTAWYNQSDSTKEDIQGLPNIDNGHDGFTILTGDHGDISNSLSNRSSLELIKAHLNHIEHQAKLGTPIGNHKINMLKESTDELLEGFKEMDATDLAMLHGEKEDLPSGKKPLIMWHSARKDKNSGGAGEHDYAVVVTRNPDEPSKVMVRADSPMHQHVFFDGDEESALRFAKERKHHIKDFLNNYDKDNKIKSLVESVDSPEDLSEEFKIKTQALFEATVSEKVNTLLEEKQQALQAEFDNKLNEATASFETDLIDKIDGYFGELSEKWMQDNEIVLEASLRSELTESFMDGMRKLFESHYVDLPVEKFDIVTSLEEQLNATKESLDSTKALLEQRQKELDSANRENILNETTQGLTEIESGKFKAMMEEFEFDNAENYSKRAEIIKESFFGPGKKELIKKNPEKQTLELSTQPLHEEVTNVGNDKPLSEVSAYAEYMKKQTKNAL